jgi:hypothetical protein
LCFSFRKFVTGVACTFVGVQSIFFSNYETVEGFEGKEHIFTHVQKDARDFVDRQIYGIDLDQIRNNNKKTAKPKVVALEAPSREK